LRGGFLQEDSFLPVHEEHKPDPEAEKYAAAVLDAEGPLLFSAAHTPVEDHAGEDTVAEEPTEEDTPVEIVGIRFRRTGKVYFFDPGVHKLKAGSYAVVETARGLEYGEVARANATVPQKQIVPPLRPVIRAATADDVRHYEENKKREDEAFRICQEKIAAHGLDMKLVEAEYTFDNSKLLFYFTSAGRVDFRELVKDLAGVFRTRIELRQIGIRDEAKLLGGLGTCGRPLCCASFLADFVQVSIKMAKEQSLSLNSTKISGCCGRLMCCLRYESDTYEEEIRRTPSVGSLLQTPEGQGTVISCNPLRGTVRVRLGGEDGTVKEFHRDGVQIIKRVAPAAEEE
jgi:cell fate regulator YaaT (PSP1 superfamily)